MAPGRVLYGTEYISSAFVGPVHHCSRCEAARLGNVGWAPHDFRFPSSFVEALGTGRRTLVTPGEWAAAGTVEPRGRYRVLQGFAFPHHPDFNVGKPPFLPHAATGRYMCATWAPGTSSTSHTLFLPTAQVLTQDRVSPVHISLSRCVMAFPTSVLRTSQIGFDGKEARGVGKF